MHSYVFDFYSHYYTAQLQFFVIFLYFIWKLSAMVHYPTLQGAPLRMTNFYLENRYSNLSFFMGQPVVYATLTSVWYKTGCIQMSFLLCKNTARLLPTRYVSTINETFQMRYSWAFISRGIRNIGIETSGYPSLLKGFPTHLNMSNR